jgi:hypothetical protein
MSAKDRNNPIDVFAFLSRYFSQEKFLTRIRRLFSRRKKTQQNQDNLFRSHKSSIDCEIV